MRYRGGGVGHQATRAPAASSSTPPVEDDGDSDVEMEDGTNENTSGPSHLSDAELALLGEQEVEEGKEDGDKDEDEDEEDWSDDEVEESGVIEGGVERMDELGAEDGEENFRDIIAEEGYADL